MRDVRRAGARSAGRERNEVRRLATIHETKKGGRDPTTLTLMNTMAIELDDPGEDMHTKSHLPCGSSAEVGVESQGSSEQADKHDVHDDLHKSKTESKNVCWSRSEGWAHTPRGMERKM